MTPVVSLILLPPSSSSSFEPGTAPGRERLLKADTEERLQPIPPAAVDHCGRGAARCLPLYSPELNPMEEGAGQDEWASSRGQSADLRSPADGPRSGREAVDRAYAARAVGPSMHRIERAPREIRLTSSPCQEARESVGRAENGHQAQPATRSRVFEWVIDGGHGGGVETRAMRLKEARKIRV